jgi:beta-lactamase superfamily II metal-dependent hydrolase
MGSWVRVAVSILLAASLIPAGGSGANVTGRHAAAAAKIVFVNVDQGDGVVMRIGGKIIVSATGEYRLDVMQDTLRSLKAKRIDVLILTHPHQDHVKNAIDLLDRWDVDLAILSRSQWWQGTDTNRALMKALEAEPAMELRYAHAGDKFDWGGATWTFLNPRKGDFIGGSAEAANASLVYLLNANGISALFTGDIERNQAKRVAAVIDPVADDRPVDIFLATHHGSKEGSIKELLAVIRPRWAVLSTGPNVRPNRRRRSSGCSDGQACGSGRPSRCPPKTWTSPGPGVETMAGARRRGRRSNRGRNGPLDPLTLSSEGYEYVAARIGGGG